ncbi:PH domain-containing protein [Glaciecola sp. 1036]|uniref:PH domain-containing protein n=1 Tax=Alteromonadaceae TaxID=72275 RepID=UPI003D0863D8
MSFTNQTISTQDISITEVELNPLSPKYMQINLALVTIFTVIPITILVFLSFNWLFEMPQGYMDNLLWFISIVFAFGALFFIYHWLADPKKGYALREHDLHFQTGLIFRKHICQPILRIQHIEIKRGPIDRKAGLATLEVYSAGGVHHTFHIPGLPHETAKKLRSFILDHTDLTLDE